MNIIRKAMTKTINWGIIGLGKIARKFAEDIKLVSNACLWGVASRDIEKAMDFAEKHQAEHYFGSYEALVNHPEIDIVYIATPHVFHFENTMLCLKANKAVLCEKAFGMNADEVSAMISEAQQRKLFLMEAMWTRFIPATERLLQILANREIGEIRKLKADFGFVGDPNPEGRLYNKALGGGSLLDIGIYPVYLSLLLLGLPKAIEASATITPQNIDTSCSIGFHYPNGAISHLASSIVTQTPTEAFIEGSLGSIRVHARFHHSEKLTILKENQPPTEIELPYKGNGYVHEIEEVMSCLQKGKTESEKMSHDMSLQLIDTLDTIREKIGLQ